MGVAETILDTGTTAHALGCAGGNTTKKLRTWRRWLRRCFADHWQQWGPSAYHARVAFDSGLALDRKLRAADPQAHARMVRAVMEAKD